MEAVGRDVEDLKKGMNFVRDKMGSVQREVEQRPVQQVKIVEKQVTKEEDARKVLSEMINYVRSTLKLGYSPKKIKQELLAKGWPRNTVNEIILREAIRRRKELQSGSEKEPEPVENEQPKNGTEPRNNESKKDETKKQDESKKNADAGEEYEPKKDARRMLVSLSP